MVALTRVASHVVSFAAREVLALSRLYDIDGFGKVSPEE
jgi:hypothetical protein